MLMKRCPSCGFENLPDAEACENCGADLMGNDVPAADLVLPRPAAR